MLSRVSKLTEPAEHVARLVPADLDPLEPGDRETQISGLHGPAVISSEPKTFYRFKSIIRRVKPSPSAAVVRG